MLNRYPTKNTSLPLDAKERLRVENDILQTLESSKLLDIPMYKTGRQMLMDQRIRVENDKEAVKQQSMKRAELMHGMLKVFHDVLHLGLPNINRDGTVSFEWNPETIQKLYEFTTPLDYRRYQIANHTTDMELPIPAFSTIDSTILATTDTTYFMDDDEGLSFDKRLYRQSIPPNIERIRAEMLDYHISAQI